LIESENLHSDIMQTTMCSHRPTLGNVMWPPFPIIPIRDSHLKLQTGNPGPTQMVAAISKKAKQLLGQGATSPTLKTLRSWCWYNQHHRESRTSSYSSCYHTRSHAYCHRQPYLTPSN